MITDIHIGFSNEYQDITDSSSYQLDNFSTIYFSDGTSRQVLPSDSLQWSWFLVDSVKTFITGDFNLPLVPNKEKLLNGYFKIILECKTPEGLVFSYCAVVKMFWNLSTENPPTAPKLFPLLSDAQSNNFSLQLVTAHSRIMGLGSTTHNKSENFRGGKIGDLDLNGVVNTTDLLLLLTNHGS